MTAYTINFDPIVCLTDDQFYQLCRANPDVKFERNPKGELLIMAPIGGETGRSNAALTADFVIWNRQAQLASGCPVAEVVLLMWHGFGAIAGTHSP